ncbi:MAG TPA: 30S ribosomal protein S20 [Planctomycetes bacterium]|nr:30S ribosomal protein S20 [Planctomycetota bacterium]
MAHSKQAKKRVRQNEEHRLHNKSLRSSMKTAIRKVNEAIKASDAEAAKAALPLAMKRIDKCAKTNIVHPNNAARKKSKLAKSVSRLGD